MIGASPFDKGANTISARGTLSLSDCHFMFVAEENVVEFCYKIFDVVVDPQKLKFMVSLGLIPVYQADGKTVILKSDLISLLDSFGTSDEKASSGPQNWKLFHQDTIRINTYTVIDLLSDAPTRVPIFFSAVRNLISEHKLLSRKAGTGEFSIPYFSGARLSTTSERILEFAKRQLVREKTVDMSETSQCAHSAHYMGSKRALCGFIVEAISSALPKSGIVIDLMCGSGVASGAFSRVWKTFSSDAQEFCRVLAVVHGGGFNRTAAQAMLSVIVPIVEKHFDCLGRPLTSALEREDKLFCCDTDESLLGEYRKFVRGFPTLSNDSRSSQWGPRAEVEQRRKNHSLYPYCLFTAYFSNVYFGMRQCVEIDSLRYAIDQLQNANEKKWALGALIATLSALGTTYGGHFAQPLVRSPEDITLKKLTSVIDRRSASITHEFAVRLLNLSEESQKSSRHVEVVPGPWGRALSTLGGELGDQSVLVYVDPPYTREEYSRFYHVLETLVSYRYPSCTGKGLTPEPSDRFRSEFFTRVPNKMKHALTRVIGSVLEKDWMCAWSYSDSGVANISEIIRSVCDRRTCDVRSYSAPFVHKSHGGARPKKITEYLIIFSPRK
jgi:hypothetical protein